MTVWAACLSWLIGNGKIGIVRDSYERNKLCVVELSNLRNIIDNIQFVQRKGFNDFYHRKISNLKRN